MRKIYLQVILLLLLTASATAQLTGIKTIKAAGGDYATFSAAFLALNSNGVGAGGVTFNVDADLATTEDALVLTATGTAANPIVFQKAGAGANPVIKPTGTAVANEFTVKITGGDYITFDGIDISINTGSAVEWGYVLEGIAANGCQNNTIKNCSITLSNANTASRGIYTYFVGAPTALSNTNSYNKFYNINIQNVYNGYLMNGNSTFQDQGNEIGTINGGTSTLSGLGGGTSTCSIISVSNQNLLKIFNQNITGSTTTTGQLLGIVYSGSTAATSASIYNNSITNLTSTGASTVNGMNVSANKITVYDNRISNIRCGTGPAAGINATGSGTLPNLSFYNNTISQVSTGGTSAINSAFGFTNSGSNVTMNFYRNNISNIENIAGGTAGLAVGVNISGTTCNVYNNFIYDIKMAAGTAPAGVRGLSLATATSYFYVYHNTVHLNYTPTAPTASGTALYLANLANSFDIRNNIFVNNMNNSGGGKAVALYAAGAGYLDKFASTTDNNLYYAGTPSATNLIYFDSTSAVINNRDQTLAAYKNRIATKDQHSVTEMPPFESAVSPYDLRLDPAIATQCEQGGQYFTKPYSVDTDIDGDARDANYPDIGADEGNFTWLDQTGPYITYVPFLQTTFLTARTLTAKISDPSGVPTSGAGLPVLYWKFNAAATYTPVTGIYAGGSNYTFTFGGGAAPGDVVYYYIVAQDIAPVVNVLSNPSAGAGGYTGNVPAAATAPVLPSSYNVVSPIQETLFVGVGQQYTSLTGVAPDGLFAALKAGVLTRNLEVRITSDLVETGAVDLTQWLEEGDGNYYVTFLPKTAGTKTINTGTLVNSFGVIRLNGVKRATFDGAFDGTGNNLTFRTKTDFTPVFYFQNDASKNIITNCTIEGVNFSSQLGLIHFGAGLFTGCDSNTVSNCIIRDRSDIAGGSRVVNLVYSDVNASSFPGLYNSGNSLINNKLFNFWASAFASFGLNEGWTISGNEIYDSLPGSTGVYAINFGSQGNNIITGNSFHDLKFGAGGTVAAILIQAATNVTISKNKIYNFPATNGNLYGIAFWGSGTGTASATVVNNQISIAPTGSTDQNIIGIWDNAVAGNTLNTYYNSVFINGTSSSTKGSWGYVRQGASTNTIRNNIFYNNRLGGGSGNYALGDQRFGTGQFTVSNNLYLGTGATPTNFMDRGVAGTGAESLDAWVSATHDISSYGIIAGTITPDALFTDVSTANLSINNTSDACWYANGKALPLAAMAEDHDGGVRSVSLATGSADIGSDEFTTTTLPPALTVTGTHAPGSSEMFSFGGRILASINWGVAGSLPSLGAFRHYTGEWPNDLTNNGTITGVRTLNEWWDMPATGGSDYSYNIVLAYDSATQGKVLNEGSMMISKKQSGVPGTWATIRPTTIDTWNKTMSASGLTSFSEFTGADLATSFSILPVTLLNFNAVAQKNDVVLNWRTATEINNRSFELERSVDGRNFISFANIAGAGNSSGVNNYTTTDAQALVNFKQVAGIYYRLKMISTTGQATYSSVVIIKPGKLMAQLVQAVMPNPFAGHIAIGLNLPEAGTVTARILDVNGRQITSNQYKAATGYSTVTISNLDNLSKGMYLLELRYNNEIITHKLVKE